MPTMCYGDMWSAYDEADLFLITTNSYLRSCGRLTMGAGIAKQARERFRGIDKRMGAAVNQRCGHLGIYNTVISSRWPRAKLGLFQVKRHYRNDADLLLIARSVRSLKQQLLTCFEETGCTMEVHLNFPGIGHGGLEAEHVLPLLEDLPRHVHIWRFDEERTEHGQRLQTDPSAARSAHQDEADWLVEKLQRKERLENHMRESREQLASVR